MDSKYRKIVTLQLLIGIVFLCALITLSACSDANASAAKNSPENTLTVNNDYRKVSEETKNYWFDGMAEISSYRLKQVRYGETHEGTAVLIYVTEPFSPTYNTKADQKRAENISVLKLNKTKKFNTGIYPYAMMNTILFPFEGKSKSLKIASSIQEWCGMTYLEMLSKTDHYSFSLDSYFEGESFQNKTIPNAILEDDLWTLLRLNPNDLPTGTKQMIPSIFYLNLTHQPYKTYQAVLNKENIGKQTAFTITYPDLDRIVKIIYNTAFPHQIINWKETYASGYGSNRKTLTTEASRITTLKVDYWNKNGNKDITWREKLGLD